MSKNLKVGEKVLVTGIINTIHRYETDVNGDEVNGYTVNIDNSLIFVFKNRVKKAPKRKKKVKGERG